ARSVSEKKVAAPYIRTASSPTPLETSESSSPALMEPDPLRSKGRSRRRRHTRAAALPAQLDSATEPDSTGAPARSLNGRSSLRRGFSSVRPETSGPELRANIRLSPAGLRPLNLLTFQPLNLNVFVVATV